MSSGNYSPAKRQRELELARKKRDKLARRMEKRERGPDEIQVVSADDVQRGLLSVEDAMLAIEARAQAPRGAAGIPARLFVGGLSDDCTAEDLRQAFGAYGPVADVFMVVDRETRAPRGFGFVTMENRKDAPRAIEMLHNAELKGRSLVVHVATERPR